MLVWMVVAMGAGGPPVPTGSIVDHLVADVDGDGRLDHVTVMVSPDHGFEVRVGRHSCVPGGYAPGALPTSEPRLRAIDASIAGVPLIEVQAEDDAGVRTYLLHVARAEGHVADAPCSRIRKVYEWHRLVDEGAVVQAPEVVFDSANRTVTATVDSRAEHGWATTVLVSRWEERLRAYLPIETWEVGATPAQERICDSW